METTPPPPPPTKKKRLVPIFSSAKCHFIYPLLVGVLYRDVGNITMAISAYEQCLEIDPDSRNAGQVLLHFQLLE
jgi:tetratricopeptide (TPR) repeat protein